MTDNKKYQIDGIVNLKLITKGDANIQMNLKDSSKENKNCPSSQMNIKNHDDMDSVVDSLLRDTEKPISSIQSNNIVYDLISLIGLIVLICLQVSYLTVKFNDTRFIESFAVVFFVICFFRHWWKTHVMNDKLYNDNQEIYSIIEETYMDKLDVLSYLLAQRLAEHKALNKRVGEFFTKAGALLGVASIFTTVVKGEFNSVLRSRSLEVALLFILMMFIFLVMLNIIAEYILDDKCDPLKWQTLLENVNRIKIENDKDAK